MVTRADIGQVTVVMAKNDYLHDMIILLSDQSTYREVEKDPKTANVEN